jgi:PAS domain S-box-containing protein
VGIFGVHGDLITYANDRILAILQCEANDIQGLSIWNLIHPSDKPEIENLLNKYSLQDHPSDKPIETRMLTKHGNVVWLEAVWHKPASTASGDFVCKAVDITNRKLSEESLRRVNADLEEWVARRSALISTTNERLHREIAARKAMEKQLRESERMYRSLVESARDIIWTVDTSTRYTYVSPSVKDVLGYTSEEIMAMEPLATLTPASRERVLSLYARELGLEGDWPDNGHTTPSERIEQYHKDGSTRRMEVTATIIRDRDGSAAGILGISRDVTQSALAGEKLKEALREKEALLREIHHRVKNNLQVISSLLRLQSKQTDDPACLSALEESRNRISTMALVHEKLYLSEDLTRVDLKTYIHKLARNLYHAQQGQGANIRLTINAHSAAIGITAAIPCGLIVNELLSNAFKHAFKEDAPGKVTLDFHKVDNDSYKLMVTDNGRGIPEEIDIAEPETMGLRLVNTLCRQLEGSMTINRRNPTRFDIQFKE